MTRDEAAIAMIGGAQCRQCGGRTAWHWRDGRWWRLDPNGTDTVCRGLPDYSNWEIVPEESSQPETVEISYDEYLEQEAALTIRPWIEKGCGALARAQQDLVAFRQRLLCFRYERAGQVWFRRSLDVWWITDYACFGRPGVEEVRQTTAELLAVHVPLTPVAAIMLKSS